MKKVNLFITFVTLFSLLSCQKENKLIKVESPDKAIAVNLFLSKDGQFGYEINYKNSKVIDTSFLGFDFVDAPSLKKYFKILKTTRLTSNTTWKMPWGEQDSVKNNYNELKVNLQEAKIPNRKINVVFRVFNNGIGFRYEFPKQEGFEVAKIKEENTEFNLTGDHKVWWIPGDWDSYEHLYNTTKVSKINAIIKRHHPNLNSSYIPDNAVNTPVTMKTAKGLYLSFHEAALIDYAGMTLKVDTTNFKLKSNLVGSDLTKYKVKRKLPFNTPWRTIQIADKAGDLIASKMILNLNDPNKIGDVSWFKPMKYVGIWWEMHLGISTWDYESTQDMNTFTKVKKKKGHHGATTQNAKRYIDFAAKNNLHGILVEGWNTGWKHWIGFPDREGVFDFITPYPDYNLKEVVRYGKSKGVQLIMHNETSAAPRTYEKQMDTAYALYKSLDLHTIKSGYVGPIIPKGEHHHGQWMVNHYNNAVIKAAKYQLAIDTHEPIKATGMRRTYPNWVSREGLRGQEFNAWSVEGGNGPEHTTIVPFTRMLAGPIDFTPGIFNLKLNPYKPNNQVETTLAKQLALYVVIYSPIQMAADLPQNYEGNPAFQFIRDVGVDWQKTEILNGEIGDFVTIARQERKTGNWFLGSITDENKRDIKINFDFLEPNTNYIATVYEDGKNADWKNNPTAVSIRKITLDNTAKLTLHLAPGGGTAISIIKK
ncbi:glycoside hydrolase family 97 protein [Lutibacter sp.]|uniref:glycoside hydrolase family 97 protein n=1 Tax=Lutibacter sp. TaxID=1925666 RepID=UPI0025C33F73|nr:glycoside hydrolase family 97 protein [Lutibacter sp.]MCF6180882.1 glycoside hydrolase family 97 protein [Lutibacter sp.]